MRIKKFNSKDRATFVSERPEELNLKIGSLISAEGILYRVTAVYLSGEGRTYMGEILGEPVTAEVPF